MFWFTSGLGELECFTSDLGENGILMLQIGIAW